MNRGEDAAGEAVSSFRFPNLSGKTGEGRGLLRPGKRSFARLPDCKTGDKRRQKGRDGIDAGRPVKVTLSLTEKPGEKGRPAKEEKAGTSWDTGKRRLPARRRMRGPGKPEGRQEESA